MLSKEIFYLTPVLVPESSAASKIIIANAKLIQLLNYNVTIFSGLDAGEQFNAEGVPIITTGIKIKEKKGIKKLISYKKSVKYFLEILIKRHKQKLYNFIYSKILDRDLTEDVFQDTFIKVIRTLKLGNYNEEGKFVSWVMRIAHNLVIDHFRKNKRLQKFQSSENFDIFSVLKDNALDAEDSLIKNQIDNDVRDLIELLPNDQKEVLIYRFYNDLSFKEISYKTGVSINTSLGRMRYALINLRSIISRKNISLTK